MAKEGNGGTTPTDGRRQDSQQDISSMLTLSGADT